VINRYYIDFFILNYSFETTYCGRHTLPTFSKAYQRPSWPLNLIVLPDWINFSDVATDLITSVYIEILKDDLEMSTKMKQGIWSSVSYNSFMLVQNVFFHFNKTVLSQMCPLPAHVATFK
jgi:hypothetical protein